MKLVKKVFMMFLLIIGISSSVTYANTFDISLKNIDNFDITGFTLFMSLGDDFIFQDANSFLPVSGMWNNDFGPKGSINGNQYKIGFADWGPLMGNAAAPLKEGVFFSFDFSGSVKGFSTVQFSDINGNDLFNLGDINLLSFDQSGAVFGSNVPIPSTFLLLGGGILVLLGGSRRKNRKREMAHEN